jgi:hypothetical protein
LIYPQERRTGITFQQNGILFGRVSYFEVIFKTGGDDAKIFPYKVKNRGVFQFRV